MRNMHLHTLSLIATPWPFRRPIVVDMAEHEDGLPALASQQALFVVCSTQGDGVPPAEARGFCTWLSKLGASEFDGVPFSVCALGDTSVDRGFIFWWGIRRLD